MCLFIIYLLSRLFIYWHINQFVYFIPSLLFHPFYFVVKLLTYLFSCLFHPLIYQTKYSAPHGRHIYYYRSFRITLRHTALGRTPLGDWSARHRDLYLTTHNTHNREHPCPPAVFEPTIPTSERPQTHALDRAATRIGLTIRVWSLIGTIFRFAVKGAVL